MAIEMIPEWLLNLEEEDVAFIKRFLLASGSLKEIAAQYGVSYPTVRLRLDRLIQKIKMSESTESDPYIAMVKHLAVDDRLDFDTAKLLINEYKKTRKEGQ
ncbi:MAG: DUF2089 family protein [Clostridiales bacterium]|nr:DUF2089 family protein [Clostridiales bacterium]MDY5366904.1 DUF2089 family protein [Eubacteriales bacterium]